MSETTGLADVAWRPPVLRTDRLVLRGYELTDAPAIFAYGADAEVARYVAFQRHTSVDDALGFLNGMVAKHYDQEELDYAITLAGDPDTVVGGACVYWKSRRHNTAELGYVLAQPQWGNGYVAEAGRAVMEHAFATTDVFRIEAPIFTVNAQSRRAAEKMGMTYEGVARGAFHQHGTTRWDLAIYSLLRSEL